jgi:ferritin-like metal-binding protein YciE
MKSTLTKPAKAGTKNESEQNDQAKALRDLFIDELKDIYYAEKSLTKALPKMIKNATAEQLVESLTEHLEVTKGQVLRLEEIFALIDEKAVAKKCEAMVGLLKEAEEIMDETEDGIIRDAGIISAGQKIEHYEIATYTTLQMFAKTLGEDEAASLLMETLEEEEEASDKLSEIYNTIKSEIGIYGEHNEEKSQTKKIQKKNKQSNFLNNN